MQLSTLIHQFDKALARLHTEISSYPDDASIWKLEGEILNSAGTLCLHLNGNLNHFIGAAIGETGYVRDRPAEFGDRDVPKAELLAQTDATRIMLRKTLDKLEEPDLDQPYPQIHSMYKEGQSVGFILLHLLGHLNYHLGQVNYHRRLIG